MIRLSIKKLSLASLMISASFMMGCSKDNTDPGPGPESGDSYSYVLMTNEGDLNTPGYITAYQQMPSGDFSNITGRSLQVSYGFGFTKYGNWIFNRSNVAGQSGIQKFTVSADGHIQDGGFLAGGAMFVIVNDQLGYYSDESRGTMILQTFNPTTMQRTGQIDLSQLKKDGVEYQVAGKHILAAKEGKLYVGLTYGTKAGAGYGDDVLDHIEMAVVDIASNKYEKLIKYPGIKSLGWGSSANKFWTLGDDGALYFYATGFNDRIINHAIKGSAIIRIKKGESDFDKDWMLKADDYRPSSTIAGALIKGGKVYIQVPSEPITADLANLGTPIWDYYAVDIQNLEAQKITGMPQTRYLHSNEQGITEIDGHIYLWLANGDQNGYYELNTDELKVTKAFNVTDGGLVAGFIHLDNK